MKKALIFLITGFMISCNNTDTGDKDDAGISMERQLLGEWNNLSIRVDIQSRNDSDSNEIFEVDLPQWEEKLRIRPIRTFFRADSTWNSAHYNLQDSLVYNPSGKWWLESGKLVMLQLQPSPDTSTYSLFIRGDTASFEAVLDWDMDGEKDDRYFGKQLKKP